MNALWGTTPLMCPPKLSVERMAQFAEEELTRLNVLSPGDVFGLVAGTQNTTGATNFMRLIQVRDDAERSISLRTVISERSESSYEAERQTTWRRSGVGGDSGSTTGQRGRTAHHAARVLYHDAHQGLLQRSRSTAIAIVPTASFTCDAGSRRSFAARPRSIPTCTVTGSSSPVSAPSPRCTRTWRLCSRVRSALQFTHGGRASPFFFCRSRAAGSRMLPFSSK